MVDRITTPLAVEADGLVFAECPRWRDGRLYFSDIFGDRVYALTPGAAPALIADFNGEAPAGLGFLPDGSLIVAMMDQPRVKRVIDGEITNYADLSGLAKGLNDMVVDGNGRAYISQAPNYQDGIPPPLLPILSLAPDGLAAEVSPGLSVANGMVLGDGGKTLICAENAGGCLTAFDVGADGRLGNRRAFALLGEGISPDGICLDAAGGVWTACCVGPGVARFAPGGEMTHLISMPEGYLAFACMLGGADGRTLFICASETFDLAHWKLAKSSRILSLPAPYPHAGLP
jgi:sugar lactone lactonase YvrE